MRLRRVSETGSLSTIPNFIVFSISLFFQGFSALERRLLYQNRPFSDGYSCRIFCLVNFYPFGSSFFTMRRSPIYFIIVAQGLPFLNSELTSKLPLYGWCTLQTPGAWPAFPSRRTKQRGSWALSAYCRSCWCRCCCIEALPSLYNGHFSSKIWHPLSKNFFCPWSPLYLAKWIRGRFCPRFLEKVSRTERQALRSAPNYPFYFPTDKMMRRVTVLSRR